mgnify:CR=1 FL=1
MYLVWGFETADARPYLISTVPDEEEACRVAEEMFDGEGLARAAVWGDNAGEMVFVVHGAPTPIGMLKPLA